MEEGVSEQKKERGKRKEGRRKEEEEKRRGREKPRLRGVSGCELKKVCKNGGSRGGRCIEKMRSVDVEGGRR